MIRECAEVQCPAAASVQSVPETVEKPPLELNLGVGRSTQTLKILEYSSGLPLAAALTLSPIEGF